jgi:hypothetical protein
MTPLFAAMEAALHHLSSLDDQVGAAMSHQQRELLHPAPGINAGPEAPGGALPPPASSS